MEVENPGKKMDDDDLLRLLDEETKETSFDETVSENSKKKSTEKLQFVDWKKKDKKT